MTKERYASLSEEERSDFRKRHAASERNRRSRNPESHRESLRRCYGGGSKHRREINRSGDGFIAWLRKHNFPPGFRVLCHNRNSSLGHYGYCPHASPTGEQK